MMSAAVSWSSCAQRLPIGRRVLRQTRQRIELAEYRDDWLAASELGDECCRLARDAGFHVETRVAQLALQQSGALLFHVADFRERPDLLCDRRVARGCGVERTEHCSGVGSWLGRLRE